MDAVDRLIEKALVASALLRADGVPSASEDLESAIAAIEPERKKQEECDHCETWKAFPDDHEHKTPYKDPFCRDCGKRLRSEDDGE